ncbi:MAG: ABC transporter ATP-binding protein [Candidatus Sericytochromatia bacterium]
MSEELHFCLRQQAPIPLELSLSCRPGEIVVLAGASGSGKTTILRSLAGLYRPSYGQIRLGDKWLLNTAEQLCLPPQQRPVGMVFQDQALFPHLNARDNIALALLNEPRAQRRQLAQTWLERVQLGHRATALPSTLSGGERQRLALGRALARQPRVLLLDEPFAALDPPLRHQLITELAHLRDRLALTVIWVTHDLQEARWVADQLALIAEGRLLQHGSPDSLWRYPASAEVAQMLGLQTLITLNAPGTETCLPSTELGPDNRAALDPEAIQINADGKGWPGHVVQSLRLGERWQISVELRDGQRLQAWSAQALTLGTAVKLSWPAKALRPIGKKPATAVPDCDLPPREEAR